MTDYLQTELKRHLATLSEQTIKNLESIYATQQKRASQRLATIRKELKRRKKEASHGRT